MMHTLFSIFKVHEGKRRLNPNLSICGDTIGLMEFFDCRRIAVVVIGGIDRPTKRPQQQD